LTLSNLEIDPEVVENEILEFKNNVNEPEINENESEHDNQYQNDNLSHRTHENLKTMNTNDNDNKINSVNIIDNKSVISNDSKTILSNNKDSDNQNKKDNLNKFNLNSRNGNVDIKAKNIKQIEFKLRSDKRVSERIKSIDKN